MRILRSPFLTSVLCLALTVLISGCAEESSDPVALPEFTENTENATSPTSKITEAQPANKLARQDNPALNAFVQTIDQHYTSLQTETDILHTRIIEFAKSPSATALDAAISAWENAHNRYLSGRYLDSLFENLLEPEIPEQTGPDIHDRLDSQPLLPGYLDAVSGYPFSGLIHSDIPITLANMYQEFQLGDTAYVTLGFHALEVMLKGTDKERDSSEFAPLKATKDTGEASAELRRTLYCSLLAEQIRQDIQQLPARWRQQIKHAVFHLNEEQTIKLKIALLNKLQNKTQTSDNAPASSDSTGHFSQTARSMEQELLEQLRISLDSKPSS